MGSRVGEPMQKGGWNCDRRVRLPNPKLEKDFSNWHWGSSGGNQAVPQICRRSIWFSYEGQSICLDIQSPELSIPLSIDLVITYWHTTRNPNCQHTSSYKSEHLLLECTAQYRRPLYFGLEQTTGERDNCIQYNNGTGRVKRVNFKRHKNKI